MAGRWAKRRRRGDDEDDNVDLSSPEHAWWAAPTEVASEEGGEPPPIEPPPVLDPYEVLGVDESASWDEITAARRRLAKELHPDRLVGASDEERARREDAIRDLNTAYSELRTRKGK